MLHKLLAILLMTCLTTACAQHAVFVSDPPGAKVLVDGQAIGTTPCNYDYQLSSGGSYKVTVDKSGFKPVHFAVKADEVDQQARNSWLAAGVIWSPLWLGTLFTKKLKDSYEFILQQEEPKLTASTISPSGDGHQL